MKLQQILQLFQESPDFLVPWAFARPRRQVSHRQMIRNPMRALMGLPPTHGHRILLTRERIGIVARTPHQTDAVSGGLCLGQRCINTFQEVFYFEKLMRFRSGCASDKGQ